MQVILIMGFKQEYNLSKSIEAALYVCANLGKVGKHKLNKLFYYADKYHLANYGRTVSGDQYKKLKYGPVPKETYEHIGFSPFFRDSFEITGNNLRAKRDPDLKELSDSDIEALNFSINEYGSKTFDELLDLSHDETWHAAKMKEVYSLDQFLLTFPEDQRKEIKDYLEN